MNVPRRRIETIVDRITESPTPIVVLGVGIPASGKSTVLKAIGNELGVLPVDVDGILNQIRGEGWNNGSYDRFQTQVRSEAVTNMRLGGVALIDSPNCHMEYRRQDIALYRLLGAHTIGAVLLDTDPQIAIQRDGRRPMSTRQGADTILTMHEALVSSYPHSSDGLDWVERIQLS